MDFEIILAAVGLALAAVRSLIRAQSEGPTVSKEQLSESEADGLESAVRTMMGSIP